MSHTDGIVDNSLDTWINTHQAAVNAQPAGFVPLATNDQDINQVAVIEDDGTLFIPAGASQSLDHIAVVEKFYQSHADLYDFLLIFCAPAINNGSIFKLVHNTTTGTTVDQEENHGALQSHPSGGGVFDPSTGVLRNLKGLSQYVDLTTLPLDPAALIPGNNDTTLSLIAQEVGHYWGMAAPFATTPGGAAQNDLLGRGGSHWSFFAHTQASSMEGNSWQDNGGVPNSFTSVANTNGYCPFDLYLMGLLDPALTSDTFFIDTPSSDTVTGATYAVGTTPAVGANITGTRVNVTAAQLSNALGARTPDFNTSQKDFKAAFIMVVANGATAPAGAAALNVSVAQVNGYRTAWEAYWNTNTLGASTMDTALDTTRPVDIYTRDNLADDGTTPTSGILYHSPDIIVRQSLVADPTTELGDAGVDPGSDPVEIGNDNFVYVRVHNRGDYPSDADIKVYFADLTGAIDPASWTLIGETHLHTVTPGGMLISDPVTWTNAPDPGPSGHFCIIAMLDDPLDPEPDTSSVVDASSYLDFVRNNNNVAYRNLTFVDLLADSDADETFTVGSFKKDVKAVLEFDGRDLPRGARVQIILPAPWRRLRRVQAEGFARDSDHRKALLLDAGKRGVIEGLPVKAGSNQKLRLRVEMPAEVKHGQHAGLEVVQRDEKRALGGVGYRYRVLDRNKVRYLGVRKTKLFYPADHPAVRRLANNSLRPFRTLDDALKYGFSPGKGLYTDRLGWRAVRGDLAVLVLEKINGSRSPRAFLEAVAAGSDGGGRAYTKRVNEKLFAARKRSQKFGSVREVYEAIGSNGPAFMELVDSLKR